MRGIEGANAIAVEETRKYATTYNREDVERIDPKTAFLQDLSELLRKYDAKINFGFCTEERTCGVLFDIKDERIFYPFKAEEMGNDPTIIWQLPGSNYPLTADNILNYDKYDMETNSNTTTRRRIEDMTLSEIKALRTRLEGRIGEAICVVIEDFQRAYDLGDVDLRVDTDIQQFRDMSGVEVADPTIKYNVNVIFADAEL